MTAILGIEIVENPHLASMMPKQATAAQVSDTFTFAPWCAVVNAPHADCHLLARDCAYPRCAIKEPE